MSNALAIASVTAVLKDLLDNALIDQSVSAAVSAPVAVTALAPDRVKTGDGEVAQLNLFLYHVAPNQGWRNVGLPSRNSRGDRLTNAPLALDLYYMVSAYGKQDFEAEILLGYAMHVLHETPVLTRDSIRKSLGPGAPPISTDLLPPRFAALTASDLAEQVELVKIVPQPLTTEEISKLWTAFQAKYRPSVAYRLSVVLIESKSPAKTPLPVLTRGPVDAASQREGGIVAAPDLVPPYPTLTEAMPPNGQTAVRLNDVLTVRGHHLGAAQVKARFRHTRTGGVLEVATTGATDASFRVTIPSDPAALPGLYTLAALLQQPDQADRVTSELPVPLAPRIVSVGAVAVAGKVTVTVKCSPKVRAIQQITLIVGERELVADSLATDPTDALTFQAQAVDLPTGTQFVRLRVDGVESFLIDRSGAVPRFDATQQVTL